MDVLTCQAGEEVKTILGGFVMKDARWYVPIDSGGPCQIGLFSFVLDAQKSLFDII